MIAWAILTCMFVWVVEDDNKDWRIGDYLAVISFLVVIAYTIRDWV